MYWRYRIPREIAQLDPVKDHLRIVRLSAWHDVAWDNVRALEFALFRTFAVPSIGELLHKTQEFGKRTQKRYDDTDLILNEILEHGYDSERGREALRRMNSLHNRFRISNDDMRYVLSTFVMEPMRWMERFAYRSPGPAERIAAYTFWAEVGKRMGIRDIPDSYEAMAQMNTEYERSQFAYSQGGEHVARATLNLFLSWGLPRALWPLGRPFLHALMDEPLRKALAIPPPPGWVSAFVLGGMALRRRILRLLPPRRKAYLRTRLKHPSYPNGYSISELGPEKPDVSDPSVLR